MSSTVHVPQQLSLLHLPEHSPPPPSDTPTCRVDIHNLDDAQINALLTGIRERRLRSYTVWVAGQEAKKRTQDEKLHERLDKACAMLEKEIARLDKVYEAIDKRCLTVQSIMLEIDL